MMELIAQAGSLLMLLAIVVPIFGALLWAASEASRRRRVGPLFALLPLTLGGWFAISMLSAPHGYAAAYDYAGALAVSGVLLLTALLLCAFPKLRRAGRMGLVAAILVLAGFGLTWVAHKLTGMV